MTLLMPDIYIHKYRTISEADRHLVKIGKHCQERKLSLADSHLVCIRQLCQNRNCLQQTIISSESDSLVKTEQKLSVAANRFVKIRQPCLWKKLYVADNHIVRVGQPYQNRTETICSRQSSHQNQIALSRQKLSVEGNHLIRIR